MTCLQGLTTQRAREVFERDGPNQLSRPKTIPEWLKFCKQLFGGFSILLWIIAIFYFVTFFLQATTSKDPPKDNVICCICHIAMLNYCFCFTFQASIVMHSGITHRQTYSVFPVLLATFNFNAFYKRRNIVELWQVYSLLFLSVGTVISTMVSLMGVKYSMVVELHPGMVFSPFGSNIFCGL